MTVNIQVCLISCMLVCFSCGFLLCHYLTKIKTKGKSIQKIDKPYNVMIREITDNIDYIKVSDELGRIKTIRGEYIRKNIKLESVK